VSQLKPLLVKLTADYYPFRHPEAQAASHFTAVSSCVLQTPLISDAVERVHHPRVCMEC
jgi:hypothetical protein